MYGYELLQQYELELGQMWRAGISHVHGIPKELEELVETRVERQESRPARKVYGLTPIGRQAFKHSVRQPGSVSSEALLLEVGSHTASWFSSENEAKHTRISTFSMQQR